MGHGDMVMCLGQLLVDTNYPLYAETVLTLSNAMDVILDNGANEGKTMDFNELSRAAGLLKKPELVLPDVLGESNATYATSTDYLRRFGKPGLNYMAVVQGTSIDELKNLVDRYAEIFAIDSLSLPRLLLGRTGTPSIRIDLANWIFNTYPKRFKLHLLGASSRWVKEVYYAATYAPHIRSIDTSMPYNFGLLGIRMDNSTYDGSGTERVDRPLDYFTRLHNPHALSTYKYNEEVYKEWCLGKR